MWSCVSIPYKRVTNARPGAGTGLKGGVSIPYKRVTNTLKVLFQWQRECVSIPYKRVTNLEGTMTISENDFSFNPL